MYSISTTFPACLTFHLDINKTNLYFSDFQAELVPRNNNSAGQTEDDLIIPFIEDSRKHLSLVLNCDSCLSLPNGSIIMDSPLYLACIFFIIFLFCVYVFCFQVRMRIISMLNGCRVCNKVSDNLEMDLPKITKN